MVVNIPHEAYAADKDKVITSEDDQFVYTSEISADTFGQEVCRKRNKTTNKETEINCETGGKIQTPLDVLLNVGGGAIEGALGGVIGGLIWSIVFVTEVVIRVLGLIMVIAGWFFNVVVQEFALNMGKYVNGSASEGIRVAWTIIRDIANIGIIGGLVATAIGTIVKSGSYNINKTLARLIIAAFLVNFSYFFAGALIDISNYASAVIYTNVVAPPSCLSNCTIPERLLNAVRIEEVHNVKEILLGLPLGVAFYVDPLATTAGAAIGGVLGQVLGSVLPGLEADPEGFAVRAITVLVSNLFLIAFLFTMTFVFLAMAALLLARFVVLILLLITSPIGIVGPAVPLLSKYSKEWWAALFSQAFFAPVFFLLAGISLTIIERLPTVKALAQGTSSAAGLDASFIGISLNFLIAIAFMIVSLQTARSMSGEAKRFSEIYKWAGKLDFSKAYGGAVWRNTLGRMSDVGLREYNKRIAAGLNRIPIIGSPMDRGIKNLLEGGRTAKVFGKSYTEAKGERKARDIEVRNIEAEQKELKELNKNGGALDQLKSAERTFKEEFERRKALPVGHKDGRRKGESLNDFRKRLENEKVEVRDKGGRGNVIKDEKGNPVKISLNDARAQAQSILNALPDGSLERLYDEDPKNFVKLSTALTSKQFTGVMEDLKVRRDIKKRMRETRFASYMAGIQNADERLKSGDLVFGSEEYKDIVGDLFIQGRDQITDDEKMNLILSSTGKGLRKMQVFWASTTNGFYTAVEKNPNISRSEIETVIRPFKRQMYRDSSLEWTAGQIALGNEGLLHPDELEPAAKEDRKIWAEKRKGELEKGKTVLQNKIDEAIRSGDKEAEKRHKESLALLDDELSFATLAGDIASGKRDPKSLTVQERDIVQRATERAEEKIEGWTKGKQPNEVNSEVKDTHFLNAALAKHLTTDQLLGIHQDQKFVDAVKRNILVNGDPSVIDWMLNSQAGRDKFNPSQKDRDEADEARKKAGRPTVNEEVVEFRKRNASTQE